MTGWGGTRGGGGEGKAERRGNISNTGSAGTGGEGRDVVRVTLTSIPTELIDFRMPLLSGNASILSQLGRRRSR